MLAVGAIYSHSHQEKLRVSICLRINSIKTLSILYEITINPFEYTIFVFRHSQISQRAGLHFNTVQAAARDVLVVSAAQPMSLARRHAGHAIRQRRPIMVQHVVADAAAHEARTIRNGQAVAGCSSARCSPQRGYASVHVVRGLWNADLCGGGDVLYWGQA